MAARLSSREKVNSQRPKVERRGGGGGGGGAGGGRLLIAAGLVGRTGRRGSCRTGSLPVPLRQGTGKLPVLRGFR